MDTVENVRLRPATPEDAEFLFSTTKAAIGPYVAEAFGRWDDEEQRARFAVRAKQESDQVIQLDAEPIGCVCVEWHPDHAFIARVLLLPAFQRRGIGSQVVREIFATARTRELPVRLQVLKVNPAQNLWRRLGFGIVGQTEAHWLMENANGCG